MTLRREECRDFSCCDWRACSEEGSLETWWQVLEVFFWSVSSSASERILDILLARKRGRTDNSWVVVPFEVVQRLAYEASIGSELSVSILVYNNRPIITVWRGTKIAE